MDVAEWLRGLGLGQYEPAFYANDIDGEVLRRLTAEDLRELGIASIGHRRRLLDAIAGLGPLPIPPPLARRTSMNRIAIITIKKLPNSYCMEKDGGQMEACRSLTG
jgi:hypothetical protein